ncbi:MAG: hypothetical protein ACJAUG_001660 [Halioglobus sp.]
MEAHIGLASDVLFGRPIKAWIDGYKCYVTFEIFEFFKGDLAGEVVIEIYPEAGPMLSVGWSYVITLFDPGELDLCSMVFSMPASVDDRESLRNHAGRDDFSRDNKMLREVLTVAAKSS